MPRHHHTFSIFKNRKGQVALFVALVFQVLFLFFAMVINVGLLVHHKINLQNSVDLAAYYGAARQAENLNAIAHMNYQVRQSWKLLAWRYRMLGSAGAFDPHPYSKQNRKIDPLLATESVPTTPQSTQDFQEAPAFCIAYYPFKEVPGQENTCKNMATYSGIHLFGTPDISGAQLNVSKQAAVLADMLRSQAITRCRDFGSYNYLMLGTFVVAFKLDQRSRMLGINALSQSMSQHEDDFYDLDGELVSTGMQNTFNNNLTAPNRESVIKGSVKIFNSLASGGCGLTGNNDSPVKWLSPVKIFPAFMYYDTNCKDHGGTAGGDITPEGRELTGQNLPRELNYTTYVNPIRDLAQYIGYSSNLTDTFNYSLGVEKNPWCMAYVGFAAETQPRIPFSPFSAVKLKARAFFKPFGGRIGPWYGSKWDPASDRSSGTSIDELVPPRPTDIASLPSIAGIPAQQKLRAANYSRYVGDPYGLKTGKMIGYYGEAIFNLDAGWKAMTTGLPTNSASGGGNLTPMGGDSDPTYKDWSELPFDYGSPTGSGDILAWDHTGNKPSRMRTLEMSAVAPNAFDVAYYSIDANFYQDYYLRMKSGFMTKVAASVLPNFRPDIGYHKGFPPLNGVNYETFSVKDQIK
ncbi:MAG TPA: Tad domain-containing protein, partial [Bdellovibrio sp.]|nr:Tad domain-containing protein [Bdellovibrio sp.]